jgi:hypothetical protein
MFLRALFAALALTFSTVATALAGGWAVTTLDALPTTLEANQPYRIGFTIRQHGQTPYPGADSSIRLTAPDGTVQVFPARAEGSVGHYVAELRFPTAGAFRWEVDQRPFDVQPLGTIKVVPAAAIDPTPARGPAPASRPSLALQILRLAVPIATLRALALLMLRLGTFVRRGSISAGPAGARATE